MTFEQLLSGNSPDAWEKLSTKQLEDLLMPFYKVTRPEMVDKSQQVNKKRILTPEDRVKEKKKEQARIIAQQFGLKMEW